ncbi:hypothetical protein B0T17DRAFT_501511 [Bombardia bombarda]|uniref:2EXR domain-containing protein n=1 Tax=Bombardia bombarda TaxID=252184 RepID=A0AA39WC94_9PEZI|nr:hypothetical protein B0T17DRAFT_501511 [Bombardia bombarda]
MAETSEVLTTTTSPSPLTTFPLFPLLPAELRILIFQFSFLPRTIELHTRLTHYADMDMNHHHDRMPKWQSLSRNPAALSVSCEARAAALEFYTVALPLAVPLAPNQTSGHRGRLLLDSDRVLYVNLEVDMIVLLGAEQHYGRLVGFLDWCRVMDNIADVYSPPPPPPPNKGRGIRRLAMSVAPWAHRVGAATLKAFARTVFADMDEFVLFVYAERMPPGNWAGGRCELDEVDGSNYHYREFVTGRGKQFREGDGWMVVGKRPMRVVDLRFVDGW